MDLSTWALLVVGGFVLFLWSIRARVRARIWAAAPIGRLRRSDLAVLPSSFDTAARVHARVPCLSCATAEEAWGCLYVAFRSFEDVATLSSKRAAPAASGVVPAVQTVLWNVLRAAQEHEQVWTSCARAIRHPPERRLPQWKLECARQAVKAGSTMNQRTMFGTGVTFIEVLTPALVEQLLNSDFKSCEWPRVLPYMHACAIC